MRQTRSESSPRISLTISGKRACDVTRDSARFFVALMALVSVLWAAPGVGQADPTVASMAAAAPIPAEASLAKIVSGSADESRLVPFAGLWRRVEDPNAESDRVDSIDTAMADLSWVVRKMASGILEKSTRPPEQVRFSWDGQSLSQLVRGVHGETQRPVELGADAVERIDPRGEAYTSQWKWTDEGLEIHWTQKQAYGRNVYRVDPSDQSLIVEQRIHVTAISDVAPIAFKSRFDRIAPPAVSSAPTQTVSGPLP